jgi:predicted PurR-regulated permease PerM
VTTDRVVDLRTRTILRILGVAIAVAVVIEVVWISRQVITWVVISLFLAVALNPLVSWIERRGHIGRGSAIGLAYLVLALAIVAIGWTFVPKLVDEVNGLVQALPGYVHDLTHGRGRLGFLERKYHVVEKVREQVHKGGAKRLLGLSGTAVAVTKSVLTIIAASVTIVFLTFFMLLEGQAWIDRFYDLLP